MSDLRYVRKTVDNYCVVDTETTGLSPYRDEVIEISCVRIHNGKIVDRYSQLIHPTRELDPFITSLTGITNEDLAGMPSIQDVRDEVLGFVGSDIIVGHNTVFDVAFLERGFGRSLTNEYIDTLQFARKLFPELRHHRLSDLTAHLGLTTNEHRALADCTSTFELYEAMKATMRERSLTVDDLWATGARGSGSINVKSFVAASDDIDPDGFFYGRHVVFTGKLERMTRKDAMQRIVDLGGELDNSVTKNTNYLILGDNDYNAVLRGEKSSKHKKAERLKLEGQDIEILDESTFYHLIEENNATPRS